MNIEVIKCKPIKCKAPPLLFGRYERVSATTEVWIESTFKKTINYSEMEIRVMRDFVTAGNDFADALAYAMKGIKL